MEGRREKTESKRQLPLLPCVRRVWLRFILTRQAGHNVLGLCCAKGLTVCGSSLPAQQHSPRGLLMPCDRSRDSLFSGNMLFIVPGALHFGIVLSVSVFLI